MRSDAELRAAAREGLRNGWFAAAGLVLVYNLLTSAASMLFGIGLFIIGGPLTLGYSGYFIRKARGEPVSLNNLFDGFNLFGPSLLLFLLEFIFIFCWSLLLFIPGLIKCLSYSMAFFILRDNPGMNALEAISASKKMMHGRKGRLFGLFLSFIGWVLLCILTLGIGFLWLVPYMHLSMAHFYEDLKKEQVSVTGEDKK
jgi:uncharacterized membrane protein